MENKSEEIDLLDCLKIALDNKFIILCFFTAGILFALAVIFFNTNIYQSQAIIELGYIRGEYGETIFISKNGDIVNKINSSFALKYPSINAVSLSEGFIKINNFSSDKNKAEKGVLDAVLLVLSENSVNADLQKQIKQLETYRNNLKAEGQQVALIDLKLFDLRNRLDNFTPPEVVDQPSVFIKRSLSPILDLIVGGFLGIFIGLVYIGVKNWRTKNKKNTIQ